MDVSPICQLAAQHFQRAPQMALHGVQRHVDDGGDLGQVEVLLEPQRDDDSRVRRQFGHEPAQQRVEHRVLESRDGRGLVHLTSIETSRR